MVHPKSPLNWEYILLAIGRGVKLLFVTVKDKTPREAVRQNGVVIDERFEVDSRYAPVSQQYRERWFTSAGFVFGDPGSRRRVRRA
jgi:hypothetical protein